jgi:hypothetical protein
MTRTYRISKETKGGTRYWVTIEEGATKTVHEVTVTPESVKQYGQGATPERLLEASFKFLLEREPKESILKHFDLSDIETYFPDYRRKIRTML